MTKSAGLWMAVAFSATAAAAILMLTLSKPREVVSNAQHSKAEQPFPSFMFYPKDSDVGTAEEAGQAELFRRFAGRQALVIGGTDGIGRGTAIAMAQAGANVAVVGRSEQKAQWVIGNMSEVASRGQHFSSLAADLLTVRGCLDFAKALQARQLRFDFLVLTLGIWPDRDEPANSDGIDKVIALDVVARFLLTRELLPMLNPGARVMSVLGSTAKAPPPPPVATMKAIALGTKTDYSLDEMLATAGVMGDTWLQHMPSGVSYMGTFPGIVATELADSSELPSFMRAIDLKRFAMDPLDSGHSHATIISSPNAGRQQVSYFDMNRVGRKTNPLAYDADFGQWVMSFLEDVVAAHQVSGSVSV